MMENESPGTYDGFEFINMDAGAHIDPSLGSDLDSMENTLSLVLTQNSGNHFGIDILSVREVIRMVEITPVPEAPEFVEGVFNLRGEIIPALDLRRRLGQENPEINLTTRIVICEIDQVTVGLIVDAVTEILRLPEDRVKPPPSIVEQVERKFVSGVATLPDKLLVVLDLREVLTEVEKAAIRGSQVQ